VLLLIGDVSDDASRYQPSEVRRFLAELGVPLIVVDLAGGEAGEAWRPTETVTDLERWRSAVRWLGADLGDQRLVWVTGRHLLKDVELGPKARASNSSAEAGFGNRGAQLRIGPWPGTGGGFGLGRDSTHVMSSDGPSGPEWRDSLLEALTETRSGESCR
jgi:hypothetical protein